MIVTEPLPSDHRCKKIRPTEKVISRSEITHEKIEKIKGQLFEGITPEQEEILSVAVKRMIQNIL